MPDRNPLLYHTSPETFQREFDFLSMYDQLRYPGLFLVQPAKSPEEVVVHVASQSISITDEKGDPLDFSSVSGAAGISKPFSPLIPPPLFSYGLRRGRLYLKTSLFLASTGHSLAPGKDIEKVLAGQPIDASGSYEFSASASATGGAGQSISYLFPIDAGTTQILLGPRIVGYYRALMAEAAYEAHLTTDASKKLGSFRSDESVFLSYPGNGWGVGSRLDVGSVVTRNNITAGLSLLNILGIDWVSGTEMNTSGSSEEIRRFSLGPDPAMVFTASKTIELAQWEFLVGSHYIFSEEVSSNFYLSVFRNKLILRLNGGYHGGPEAALSVGRRGSLGTILLTLNLHSGPFTRQPVLGVGLGGSIGR